MWKGFSISAPRFTLEQVSDEIEALPQNEQEKIRSDLHGSSAEDAFVEKPEIVDQALRDLTLEISLIPNEEKAQFLRALALCPDYVNERAFCLMFLRGEEFDTKAAARRMVAHWEAKVSIFGEIAFKRIAADDMPEEDHEALTRGGFRFLPEKDKNGRGILLVDRSNFDQRITHRQSMVRVCWYLLQVALEDDTVQKNGIVIIAGHPRRPTTLADQDRKLDSILLRYVRNAIPIKVVAVHHFTNAKLLEYLVPVLMAFFGPTIRKRYVPHAGTEWKFLEELQKYGIDGGILPLNMGGKLDFNYLAWLEDRRARGV